MNEIFSHQQPATSEPSLALLLELALFLPAADDESIQAGLPKQLGKYQIGPLIGKGGKGLVFLAWSNDSDFPVAIKVLTSAYFAHEDDARRFMLEIETAAHLDHPHIIRILTHGETNGTLWYAMDYASGRSLAEHLAKNDSSEAREKDLRHNVSRLIQVANALHYAHERGIIHRDIKPANILLNESGEPRIADFGIARLIHQTSGATMTGSAMGTPGYMAQEQAMGGEITIAADLYSLGIILYQIITGNIPFHGNTPLETLRLQSRNDPPSLKEFAPWIDRDLATVCLKAIQQNRMMRYATAATFAEDLQAWLDGRAVIARPLRWHERAVRWMKVHPVAATMLGMLGILLSVVAGMIFFSSLMIRSERNHAIFQEKIARTNAAAAAEARDEYREQAYAADMHLAYRAFDDGHLGITRRMLAKHQPVEGLADIRGFEWYALRHRSKGDDIAAWTEHQAAVDSVQFSPDGKYLASASKDGSVIIRSLTDKKIHLQLPMTNAPRGAAEIPLITSLTSRSKEVAKRLMADPFLADDIRMRCRPSKLGVVSTIAWSADGRFLATAGLGSYIRLWSTSTGELVGIAPETTTKALVFTKDEQYLIALTDRQNAIGHHQCKIYQRNHFALRHTIDELTPLLAYSQKNSLLATVRYGSDEITICDPHSLQLRRTIATGMDLTHIAFSQDGASIHATDRHGATIATWELSNGARRTTTMAVSGKFEQFIPSACGTFFASTGAKQGITWQHIEGQQPAAILSGHEDAILSLSLSPDGHYLASGGNDHTVRLWNFTKPQIAPDMPTQSPFMDDNLPEKWQSRALPSSLHAICAAGFWMIDKKSPRKLSFIPHNQETPIRQVNALDQSPFRLITSADGELLAAFYWPHAIKIAELHSHSWQKEWILSPGTVGPIVFSPDKTLIASGGDDNRISIHSAQNGTLITHLLGHQNEILALAFSPNGKTLVSCAKDQTIRLWHCATWREIGVMHRGETASKLVFSEDGSTLFAASDNGIRTFSTK